MRRLAVLGILLVTCGDPPTDAESCGASAVDCLGGACVDGACGVARVAQNPGGTAGEIAVDDSHVYWVSNHATHEVYRAPKGGGSPESFTESTDTIGSVVAVGDDVYWSTVGLIMRAPKACEKPDCASLVATGPEDPADMFSDGQAPYWLDGGTLLRLPAGASRPQTVGSPGHDTRFAVDDEYVYIAGSGAGISRIPKDGSAPTPEPAVPPPGLSGESHSVAVDATNLYWAVGEEVLRARKDGSEAPVTLVTVELSARVFGADDEVVYFGDNAPGVVTQFQQIRSDGTAAAVGLPTASGIESAAVGGFTMDATALYYSDATGLIVRLAKQPNLGQPDEG